MRISPNISFLHGSFKRPYNRGTEELLKISYQCDEYGKEICVVIDKRIDHGFRNQINHYIYITTPIKSIHNFSCAPLPVLYTLRNCKRLEIVKEKGISPNI